MSKANAEIRTKHSVRYRHPPREPHQPNKPHGPWYLTLSIYRGRATKAKQVNSGKHGLSWAKKPDPEAAADEFLQLLSSHGPSKQPSPPTDAAGSGGEPQGGRSRRSDAEKPAKGREGSGKSPVVGADIREELAAALTELGELNAQTGAGGYEGGDEDGDQEEQEPKQTRQRKRKAPFGNRRKERQQKGGKWLLSEKRRQWRNEQIKKFEGVLERGEMACVVDKDGAPTRHQDLTPTAARELTRRIGSMCFYLELVNEMSNRASNLDALAATAGRPFKLQGSTVRTYLTDYHKQTDT